MDVASDEGSLSFLIPTALVDVLADRVAQRLPATRAEAWVGVNHSVHSVAGAPQFVHATSGNALRARRRISSPTWPGRCSTQRNCSSVVEPMS